MMRDHTLLSFDQIQPNRPEFSDQVSHLVDLTANL